MTTQDDNPYAPPSYPPPSGPAFPPPPFGEDGAAFGGFGPPSGPPTQPVPGMLTEPIGVMPAPTNESARTAVILGALSLILTPIVGIAAIAIGRRARKEIARTGAGGAGSATAGIWMGGVFSILWVLGVAFLISLKVGSIAA